VKAILTYTSLLWFRIYHCNNYEVILFLNRAVYLIYKIISDKFCKEKAEDSEKAEEDLPFLKSGEKKDLQFRVCESRLSFKVFSLLSKSYI